MPPDGSSSKQQRRIPDERPRQLQAPLARQRQFARQPVRIAAKPDPFDQRLRPLPPRGVPAPAADQVGEAHAGHAVLGRQHVLEHGHAPEDAQVLEGPDDAEPHDPLRRQAEQVHLPEADPAGGFVDAGERVDECGLAGAVRADQAQHLRLRRRGATRPPAPSARQSGTVSPSIASMLPQQEPADAVNGGLAPSNPRGRTISSTATSPPNTIMR